MSTQLKLTREKKIRFFLLLLSLEKQYIKKINRLLGKLKIIKLRFYAETKQKKNFY